MDNSEEMDTEDLASVEAGTMVETDTEVPAVAEVDTMEDPAAAEVDTMVEVDTLDKDGEEIVMDPETEEEEEEAVDLEMEGFLF